MYYGSAINTRIRSSIADLDKIYSAINLMYDELRKNVLKKNMEKLLENYNLKQYRSEVFNKMKCIFISHDTRYEYSKKRGKDKK